MRPPFTDLTITRAKMTLPLQDHILLADHKGDSAKPPPLWPTQSLWRHNRPGVAAVG